MEMPSQGPPARSRVGAVLFDYGLVLTGPPDDAAWEEMKGMLGAAEDVFHPAYWRHRHDYDRGALNAKTYWEAVARDLHRSMVEPALSMLLEADVALWTRPNQPMIDWARALQQAGVRTGILSNIGDAMETGVMRSCPWMEGFSHRTFSHRLGIAKPDPAVYRHAAKGLGVSLATVLFIDDREDNTLAALAAGMQAIQYRSHAGFVREMRERGYQSELPLPN